MSKTEAVFNYTTSMSIFKQWQTTGLITADELSKIDTMIAEKYGLSLCSIYRNIDLLCAASNGNMGLP